MYDENLVFSIIGSSKLTITDLNKKTHRGRQIEIFTNNSADNLSLAIYKMMIMSPVTIPDE